MLLKVNLDFYKEKQEKLKNVEKDIIEIIKKITKRNMKK